MLLRNRLLSGLIVTAFIAFVTAVGCQQVTADAERAAAAATVTVSEWPQPNALELYLLAFRLRQGAESSELAQFPPPYEAAMTDAEAMQKYPGQVVGQPSDIPIDLLNSAVDANARIYATIEQAIAGRCFIPLEDSFTLSNGNSLDMYVQFRESVRLMKARSILRFRERRYLEAALDAINALHIATALAGAPDTAGRVTALSLEGEAIAQLTRVTPHLVPFECQIVMHALAEVASNRPPLSWTLTQEREVYRVELLDRWANTPKSELANELSTTEQPIDADMINVETSWQALNDFYTRIIREAEKPYWERAQVPLPEDPVARLLALGDGNAFDPLIGMSKMVAHVDARLGLTMVQLACVASKDDAGHWPASLLDLVPDYLAAIPPDPFTGGPLKLAVREGKSVLYSVGPDGVDGTEDDIVSELQQ